jgi:hypothetical protein
VVVPIAAEQAADLTFLESQFSNVPIHPECEADQTLVFILSNFEIPEPRARAPSYANRILEEFLGGLRLAR